ncbi:Uncharacterised protein [Mycobacterium tuberculosis]|uniref:Uncharacterized protein n=1 Tax=Mycobacterium tuberculosis TaxID=1773 RepID=A0A0U0RIL4_MYCTX|nr:Uncharacterised protein [Mycobacterium tuberculosis]COW37093.1 Uncharacterised protein [Mycobacterium tuberculosis]
MCMVWRRSQHRLFPRRAVAHGGREEGISSCQEPVQPLEGLTSRLHRTWYAA